MSVAAPLLMPCTKMVAPMMSSFVFASLIVPRKVPSCAIAAAESDKNKIMRLVYL